MRKLTLQFHRFNAVSDRQQLRGGILSEFQELAETKAISAGAELANLYAQICKLRVRRGPATDRAQLMLWFLCSAIKADVSCTINPNNSCDYDTIVIARLSTTEIRPRM